MTFECPSCKKQGFIDDDKVPAEGIYANCPVCGTKFKISKPSDFTFESDTPAEEQTKTFVPPSLGSSSPQPKTAVKPVEGPIYKKINPNICGTGIVGGYILIALSFLATDQKQIFALVLFAGGLSISIGAFYSLVSLARCWDILQGTTARTTTNKAIGFLFIPFFNFYWIFIAKAGLSVDANKYAIQQNLSKRISYGLAVSICILTLIPYLNLIAPILTVIFVYQLAGVNNEILDKWDQLSNRPNNKNEGSSVLIIALAVFASLLVIGIIAAIAIPQFSNYQKKSRLSAESQLNEPQPSEQQASKSQQLPDNSDSNSMTESNEPNNDIRLAYNCFAEQQAIYILKKHYVPSFDYMINAKVNWFNNNCTKMNVREDDIRKAAEMYELNKKNITKDVINLMMLDTNALGSMTEDQFNALYLEAYNLGK